MRRRVREAGDSKLGCILWLLALAVMVWILLLTVPVKMHSVELYDFMKDEARSSPRATAELLRDRIVKRAEELGLPLDPKNVTVKRGEARVRIEARYTVPVEFPGYTYFWRFEQVVDEPVFIF